MMNPTRGHGLDASSHGGTPGSPVVPLLAGETSTRMFQEPAARADVSTFFASVSLPPGKAGLRRRIVLALERLSPAAASRGSCRPSPKRWTPEGRRRGDSRAPSGRGSPSRAARRQRGLTTNDASGGGGRPPRKHDRS